MKRFSGVALAVTLLCSMTARAAGPFGLEMGMSEQALSKLTALEPSSTVGHFQTKTLPGGHPAFVHYSFATTPDAGLCKIVASTPQETGAHGAEIKQTFNELERSLAKKYGPPSEAVDSLNPHSAWRAYKDWMMALRKNDRVLKDSWSIEKADLLPSNIKSITLQAKSASQTSAYVTLTYEFRNAEACDPRPVVVENQALDDHDQAL